MTPHRRHIDQFNKRQGGTPMSWKPEVMIYNNNGKWSRNGLTFATEQEAKDSAYDLMMRWTSVEDHRAVEVDEPVTHTYHGHTLERVA